MTSTGKIPRPVEGARVDVAGRGNRFLKPHWIWVALAIVVTGITMQRSLMTGTEIAETHVAFAHGAANVKFEAAIAHLVFEEVLAGDDQEHVDQVWAHLDKAKAIARSMQDAGAGHFESEQLGAMVDDVVMRLDLLRSLAESRLIAHEEDPSATHGDIHYDALFDTVIAHCEDLESLMWNVVDAELVGFRRDQHALIGICILLALAGVVTAFRSEKSRRDQALELGASQTRLQHALKGADLGSWEWEVDTERMNVNRRWFEMLGLPGSDASVQRSFREEQIHPEDREAVLEALEAHLRGDTDAFEAKFRMRHSAGTWIRVLERGRLLDTSETGRPLCICGTLLDITHDWEATRREQHLEKQVLHAQKLESLGVLAGGIAHDFGNLLMPILACADLAQMELPKDSAAREHLREIVKAANHASDLVRQMLSYTGREQFTSMSLDMTELIRDMEELLNVSISKTVSRSMELDPNLPAFHGDPTQIRQVIMNLVTNASEAIDSPSGKIVIQTGAKFCSQAYLDGLEIAPRLSDGLPPLQEGEFVFLRVTDDGAGMDLETQQRIFDPFFSTKFAGRGLGMASTLGIVSHHGGVITIETQPGLGTSLCILFPVADGESIQLEEPPEVDRRATAGERSRGCILLAEDEDLVASATTRMLEKIGFCVLRARDGQEALEMYAERRDVIDLALVDLTMPRVDGMQTLHELRVMRPELPVVLYSAYGRPSELPVVRDGVFTGFLRKPFTVADLEMALRLPLLGARSGTRH